MAHEQFSTDEGIVDETGKPIVREQAPVETAAQRAEIDADVSRLFKDERGVSGERKFGKPPVKR